MTKLVSLTSGKLSTYHNYLYTEPAPIKDNRAALNRYRYKKRTNKYNSRKVNRFITGLAALIIILIISFLLMDSSAFGYSPKEYTTVVVSSGDTLWSIASEKADGTKDIRSVLSEIRAINDLDSDILYEGTILKVPLN